MVWSTKSVYCARNRPRNANKECEIKNKQTHQTYSGELLSSWNYKILDISARILVFFSQIVSLM